MASRFTALKLSSGEAFLLETEHAGRRIAILVDSGKSKSGLAHPLCIAIRDQAPDVSHIDIAVCTHKDKDHSAGFATFADAWIRDGGTIGEFWLPGRWAINFPNLLVDQEAYLSDLVEGFHEALQSEHLDGSERLFDEKRPSTAARVRASYIDLIAKSELITDRQRGVEAREFEMFNPDAVEERRQRLATALGTEVARLAAYEIETGVQSESLVSGAKLNSHFYFWGAPVAFGRLQNLMETADEIAAIADSAVRNSIPIRWFDFDPFERGEAPRGGVWNVLTPLNSQELRSPPPREDTSAFKMMLFFSLHLSEQNVESLVFLRPETKTEPAVLFLGDSRLAFGVDKPEKNFNLPKTLIPSRALLATAPHHGSRVNDRAYDVLNAWLGAAPAPPPLYVRNGGQWNQTLAKFLNTTDRACVHCWNCEQRKVRARVIVVTTSNGAWDWSGQKSLCLQP